MKVHVFAKVLSPLGISMRRATGFDLETLSYVPGAVLRGALAESYLSANDRKVDGTFERLFLQNLVRYGDLRPQESTRWPLSARECKVDGTHPLVDALLASAAGILPKEECRECGHKRRLPSGFRAATVAFDYEDVQPITRRVTHIEMDAARGCAAGGLMHSSRMICAGQELHGGIRAQGTAEPAIRNLLNGGVRVFLGRGRTRGQGEVELTVADWSEEGAQDVEERVRKLNGRAGRFPALATPDRVFFAATMQSPAIVYDRWLLSRPYLTARDLDAELGDYKLAAWFARMVEISGWNAAAGMPKSAVQAIAPGSCFLFSREVAPAGASAEMTRIGPILANCQIGGVGERRAEGFGEVVACDAFHAAYASGEDE